MRLRFVAIVMLVILHPGVAFADAAAPGRSRVPHDLVIEVDSDFPAHRFWLVSRLGVEPLDLVPGRPFLVSGDGRNGGNRVAYIVAVPIEFVEEIGMNDLPPDAARSNEIDFHRFVPFYDSRERVIGRYRLEFVPGQHVRLVQLDENTGSRWIKRAWAVAGGLAGIAVVGGGFWAGRRMIRSLAAGRF